ncbi:MAG TPA: CoA transferase [Pseudomonadales bacterium]|nr:CoA transferase [Pseudomonadales bacterium]
MSGVLEGIRVLDFGRYIAGPYCAALLADMGAEVIRIEKVDGSEDRYNVPFTAAGEGPGFLQMARGKRGMTLNPTKPEGREIVRRLVATADVVVANLPRPTLVAMGLDLESLQAVKPDIILTTASAYGSTGPYAERVGFDAVAQAMSGNMYLSGDGTTPMKSYVPYVDFATAALTAMGTVAALLHRKQTGVGQMVEGSLLATALTIANAPLMEQAQLGLDREATGNRGQTAGPVDCFRTRDGWIMLQVVGDPLFARWARLMGEESEWLEDPRFGSDAARGEHGELISARMQRWCDERSNADALAALAEARIPCGEVLSPARALVDPHVVEAGFLKPVAYPGTAAPALIADTPVKFSATEAGIRGRAPTLGEHTDAILEELGYDAEAIAGLRTARVV